MRPTEAEQQAAFERLQRRAVVAYAAGVEALLAGPAPVGQPAEALYAQQEAAAMAIAAGLFAERARGWFLAYGVVGPEGFCKDPKMVDEFIAEMMDIGQKLSDKMVEMGDEEDG